MDAFRRPERPESVSIVIPCFNESEVIRDVLLDIKRCAEAVPGIHWEYMVVDDASTDGSFEAALSVEGIKVLRNPQNRGYGYSLKRGIKAITGEYVITMDADGQHDPKDISRFVDNCPDFDLVAGNRLNSSGVPLTRRPGKWVLLKCLKLLTGTNIPDLNCGYRIFRRETLEKYMYLFSNRYSFSMSSTMIFLANECFVDFLEITCRPRKGGDSRVKWTTALDTFLRMVRIIILFHPLRIFIPLGAFFAFMAFLSGVADIVLGDLVLSTALFAIMSFLCAMFGLLADQNSYGRKER